jgi:hypothetical protein
MLTRMANGAAQLLEGRAAGARAFNADAGKEVGWSETVAPGDCVRIAVGSEGEGSGLVGRVVDAANGDEIDRAHAAESVALRACAEGAPRTVIVTVVVTAGKLAIVVGERVVR